ncbi:hypothetical protein [Peribacillus frigoritolerans]|uniref:hypothetical protein n=1 Tax=Peribacillus frigoritolerans TaxID=450367 RepID=UPI002079E9E5|nr:hypothetical protein [Peribacillus frigoritolerans]USK77716.1 hypothetical protein LIT31_26535 [Peribacillus frigoritolerans]USK77794.1 hypothetical protein LIT31_26060 [Peribacillus frigoritolerans]USK77874.1 hypothetical protein LIT31_27155 [Peribacillus frigoritolerans]
MTNTIVASLSYARQQPKNHAITLSLLEQLGEELNLEGLSFMREVDHILNRIYDAEGNPKKYKEISTVL